jgi:hypothetical protein
MRCGLRLFYFERILSIVAKLTAIAEKHPVYSVKSFHSHTTAGLFEEMDVFRYPMGLVQTQIAGAT